jgi:hypothetical protein
VKGPLELLRGEKMPCATGRMGQRLARALDGKVPPGIVQGRIPDLPDPYTQRLYSFGIIFCRSEGPCPRVSDVEACARWGCPRAEAREVSPEPLLIISIRMSVSRCQLCSKESKRTTYRASSEQAPASNTLQSEDAASERRAQSHLARLMPLQTFAGECRNLGERGGAMIIVPAPAKAPPASNSLVRLKESRPQRSRSWRPGHRVRPSVDLSCCCEKTGPGWLPRETTCVGEGWLVEEEQALASPRGRSWH